MVMGVRTKLRVHAWCKSTPQHLDFALSEGKDVLCWSGGEKKHCPLADGASFLLTFYDFYGTLYIIQMAIRWIGECYPAMVKLADVQSVKVGRYLLRDGRRISEPDAETR